MSYLVSFDTSQESAQICLGLNGQLIASAINPAQKDHAAWLQPALQLMLKEAGVRLQQLDAVAVVAGPGSYTGLRVGLASAKGLCYALKKPLICLDGLQLMAASFFNQNGSDGLVCPMVDARRMEVFTALYNSSLDTLIRPQAMILEATQFDDWLIQSPVYFIGNGAGKYKVLLKSTNARFPEWSVSSQDIIWFTQKMYERAAFADLAYSEPMYIKAFYHPAKAN